MSQPVRPGAQNPEDTSQGVAHPEQQAPADGPFTRPTLREGTVEELKTGMKAGSDTLISPVRRPIEEAQEAEPAE